MACSGQHSRYRGQNGKKGQRGMEQFISKEMRQEIKDIETNMEDTVQMYCQRARARAGQMDGKTQEEGQELA